MNELKDSMKELDEKVYRIIDEAFDKERASQALEYYLNGNGSPLSLIELGISEAIRTQDLNIYDTLREAYGLECYANKLGNLSLTNFCIDSGLFCQFFKVERSAGKGSKHLYVIQMSNESVKIGIAYDIKRRYSQIKASSGMEIVKHWESEKTINALVFETALHRKYKDKRLKGEYFNIDYDEAVEQAQQIAMIGG